MNRRSFFAALLSIPFVRRFAPVPRGIPVFVSPEMVQGMLAACAAVSENLRLVRTANMDGMLARIEAQTRDTWLRQ